VKMRHTDIVHTHNELARKLGLGNDVTRLESKNRKNRDVIAVGNGEWRLEPDGAHWRHWLYPVGSPVQAYTVHVDHLIESQSVWDSVLTHRELPRGDGIKSARIDLWFDACEQLLNKVLTDGN
jgi:hypothetical protein